MHADCRGCILARGGKQLSGCSEAIAFLLSRLDAFVLQSVWPDREFLYQSDRDWKTERNREMPKKTFTPEQIVGKLRQIEVLVSQGKTVRQACKEAGITDQTFYRWRKEYGGLQVEQAKKMRDLQRENAQLKRAVADLTVEKQILKDIAPFRPEWRLSCSFA
jgi:putative transposase